MEKRRNSILNALDLVPYALSNRYGDDDNIILMVLIMISYVIKWWYDVKIDDNRT